MYVRGKHCGLPDLISARIDADLTNWIFTHVRLSAHAHNNYCQEVEVHGWLLSVRTDDTTEETATAFTVSQSSHISRIEL